MNVQPVPDNQWTKRMELMKEAAEKIGKGDRFEKLELAVSFDPNWKYDCTDPHNPAKSKRFWNAQGVEQGTCIHLGNCDIGCDVDAKNTLDKNYIPWAEKHGAEVRPLHLVSDIAPITGGYRVSYDELKNGKRVPGSETARIVIVAAGSLGSTELLLRCRDLNGSLPNISAFLGRDWSSNGDFLTPAFYAERVISPTRGPTIASAIDFLDGSEHGQRFWIEDGGVPDLLVDYFQRKAQHPPKNDVAKILIDWIRHFLREDDPFKNVMPWFAQGMDAANGVFSLKRPWWFFGSRRLHLDWDITESKPVIDAIVKMHERLSAATGGIPRVPPTWSLAHYLVTPHPLGGCNIGDTSATGVVNHKGEIFGYKNQLRARTFAFIRQDCEMRDVTAEAVNRVYHDGLKHPGTDVGAVNGELPPPQLICARIPQSTSRASLSSFYQLSAEFAARSLRKTSKKSGIIPDRQNRVVLLELGVCRNIGESPTGRLRRAHLIAPSIKGCADGATATNFGKFLRTSTHEIRSK